MKYIVLLLINLLPLVVLAQDLSPTNAQDDIIAAQKCTNYSKDLYERCKRSAVIQEQTNRATANLKKMSSELKVMAQEAEQINEELRQECANRHLGDYQKNPAILTPGKEMVKQVQQMTASVQAYHQCLDHYGVQH